MHLMLYHNEVSLSYEFLPVTGTSVHLVNAILSAVCVFYTMIGGVKAVVWTDVVQAIVMISSSFVVVTIGKFFAFFVQ